MIKLPQGKSNYRDLVLGGYHYVDKTGFVRELEELGSSYLFFLRPRRFGKSLLVSMLMHYYGEQHRGEFQQLFGKYDIGRRPTPLANAYFTLTFMFSGINTSTHEGTHAGFLTNVLRGVKLFFQDYPQHFNEAEDFKAFEDIKQPEEVLKEFFSLFNGRLPGRKIYLLIDEYDHFANELLAFDFDFFRKSVSSNGFVRKFYEVIKDATFTGTVERLFVTGVTPITLDSMTSGFNISSNISTNPRFQGMAGFLEEDVQHILEGVGVNEGDMAQVLADTKAWYDGYLFNSEAEGHIYNPNMVLYFAEAYRQFQKYPSTMLDINVASDYQKVGRLFGLVNPVQNVVVLEELVEHGYTEANLTAQFNFERNWTRDDFVSMLFYLGYLTIAPERRFLPRLAVPNYVIRELYFRYFLELVLDKTRVDQYVLSTTQIGSAWAFDNDPKPFTSLISNILRDLSDRDKVGFDEKYVKSIAVAILHASGLFFIKSEYPVQGGYVDVLLLQRPQHPQHHQFALELKYLPKKEAKKLAATVAEAKEQLTRYRADPQLASVERLKVWLMVVVGNEVKVMEEVAPV